MIYLCCIVYDHDIFGIMSNLTLNVLYFRFDLICLWIGLCTFLSEIMANQQLKQQVLQCFKSLHRVRERVFAEDVAALTAARAKINQEFRKNKHVSDPVAITELINFGKECETVLKSTVIQARKTKDNTYELRITADTVKLDNVPFKDCVESDVKS